MSLPNVLQSSSGHSDLGDLELLSAVNPARLIVASRGVRLATGEVNAKLLEGLMVFKDGVESVKRLQVDAERVFALIDKDLRKTHGGFLRGKRLSYNVVSLDQVRPRR